MRTHTHWSVGIQASVWLFVVVACNSDASGLEVIVSAEQEVAVRSSRVSFEVVSQEGDIALQETFNVEQTPFPIRRLVAPRGGDASRVVTITARAVNAAGDTLTTARIIRSFVPGRRVEVRLRLYELCLGTNCPEGLTCEPINGRAECVDARVTEGTPDAGVDSDAPNVCPGTQTLCDDKCVETQSDEAHCGQCGRACSNEQVCSNGTCQIVSCDGPADCSSGNYCNMNTGRCLPGCDEPSDCGNNSSCNISTNQCECATGYHPCSSSCLPNNAVTSCGERCSPCDGLTNGTASCQTSGDAFICASMCNDGFNLCNGTCALASSPASCGPSCTVCPGSSRGTAICNAGSCSLLCNQGTTMCSTSAGQDCVDTTSDANHCGTCGRVCSGGQICQGSNCIDPPNCDVNNPASCTGLTYCNPSNNRCAAGCDPRLSNQCGSNQTCTANQCVCTSGTHDCGGVCLNNGSVNSCGLSCSPCALALNATRMGCNGIECTVTSCIAGYQPSENRQRCEDINECASNNGGCGVAVCDNTIGSFQCGCTEPNRTCNGTCVTCPRDPNSNGTECRGNICVITGCTGGLVPRADGTACARIFGGAPVVIRGPTPSLRFGSSVSLAADGHTLAVGDHAGGADYNGGVMVYTRTSGNWNAGTNLTRPSDASDFGASVSLSSDGNTLAVGDPGAGIHGTAPVYARTNGVWRRSVILNGLHSNQYFGSSVSVSSNGHSVVVGDPGGEGSFGRVFGFATVFDRGTGWTGVNLTRTGSEFNFGRSVSMSSDGSIIAVGDPNGDDRNGAVTMYNLSRTGTNLTRPAGAVAFGFSVSVSADGNTLVVGDPGEEDRSNGAVTVYTRSGNDWIRGPNLTRPNGAVAFGFSVSISADGTTLVVGDPGVLGGHATVYQRNGGTWTTGIDLSSPAGSVNFGHSVSISPGGSTVVVGDDEANAVSVYSR